MRPVRTLTLAAVLLAAVAGCASTARPVVAGSPPPSHSSGPPLASETFGQRAAELAAAWDGSPLQQTWENGYVPLGDTAHLPADAFHSGSDKAAYLAGQFHIKIALPTGPAEQTVRFDSGASVTRPGIGAAQALRTDSLGRCPTDTGCPTWLTVTAARFTTERVPTNKGEATVPAWAFRIQGYRGEFVFAAVEPQTIPKPVDTARPNGYQGASLVSVSADGRTLTLGATRECGRLPPEALVYETKDVVVVGATDKPGPPASPGTDCTLDLPLTRLQAHLGDVLDGRTVVDVESGLPEAPTG